MQKLFGSILLLCLFQIVYAQKPPIKFGDIPIEQLKMTKYEKDSAAAAVVLADFGDTRLEYIDGKGFLVKFERIRRIKIISKEGYEWGNFSIPLYKEGSNEEDLATLKAVTYNLENGKVIETKMKNDAVFREETDKNIKTVKFTLPNVKEGSVIENRIQSIISFSFQFSRLGFSNYPTNGVERIQSPHSRIL